MLCYSLYKFAIDRLLQTMNEQHNKRHPVPGPPKGYMFDEPDVPETIVFENALMEKDQDQEQESVSASLSGGLSIKAATLIKLIEHLTHPLYLHPKFSYTFLMVFREFVSCKQLLHLLVNRFDVPNLTAADLELANQSR